MKKELIYSENEKPVIATTLAGLFISNEPWKQAHEFGMRELSELTSDKSILDAKNFPDYFSKVEEAISKIYPKLSPEERIKKRRGIYFDRVIKLLKENPEYVKKEVIDFFKPLKKKFKLALITTNKDDSLKKILKIANMQKFFDVIETTMPEEKDDKKLVFERFLSNYGKPIIYIGASKRDSYDICKQENIPCIFANLEDNETLDSVDTVFNLEELKEKLRVLNK